MATVLENYYGYRQQLLQRMAQPPISPADLWLYGEILYRIGVLETCQMYLRSAPITREVREPDESNSKPTPVWRRPCPSCVQSQYQ